MLCSIPETSICIASPSSVLLQWRMQIIASGKYFLEYRSQLNSIGILIWSCIESMEEFQTIDACWSHWQAMLREIFFIYIVADHIIGHYDAPPSLSECRSLSLQYSNSKVDVVVFWFSEHHSRWCLFFIIHAGIQVWVMVHSRMIVFNFNTPSSSLSECSSLTAKHLSKKFFDCQTAEPFTTRINY